MLNSNSLYVAPQKWTPAQTTLSRHVARNLQDAQIFVHPGVNKQLCESVIRDRQWIKKIWRYWVHYWHTHLRVKCQIGSPLSRQALANDKGWDKPLFWWSSDEAWNPENQKTKNSKQVKPKALMVSDLSKACTNFLTTQ